MTDPTRMECTLGLRGPAMIEIKMHIPNPFEITPEERKVAFAILDAVREFQAFCDARQKRELQ